MSCYCCCCYYYYYYYYYHRAFRHEGERNSGHCGTAFVVALLVFIAMMQTPTTTLVTETLWSEQPLLKTSSSSSFGMVGEIIADHSQSQTIGMRQKKLKMAHNFLRELQDQGNEVNKVRVGWSKMLTTGHTSLSSSSHQLSLFANDHIYDGECFATIDLQFSLDLQSLKRTIATEPLVNKSTLGPKSILQCLGSTDRALSTLGHMLVVFIARAKIDHPCHKIATLLPDFPHHLPLLWPLNVTRLIAGTPAAHTLENENIEFERICNLFNSRFRDDENLSCISRKMLRWCYAVVRGCLLFPLLGSAIEYNVLEKSLGSPKIHGLESNIGLFRALVTPSFRQLLLIAEKDIKLGDELVLRHSGFDDDVSSPLNFFFCGARGLQPQQQQQQKRREDDKKAISSLQSYYYPQVPRRGCFPRSDSIILEDNNNNIWAEKGIGIEIWLKSNTRERKGREEDGCSSSSCSSSRSIISDLADSGIPFRFAMPDNDDDDDDEKPRRLKLVGHDLLFNQRKKGGGGGGERTSTGGMFEGLAGFRRLKDSSGGSSFQIDSASCNNNVICGPFRIKSRRYGGVPKELLYCLHIYATQYISTRLAEEEEKEEQNILVANERGEEKWRSFNDMQKEKLSCMPLSERTGEEAAAAILSSSSSSSSSSLSSSMFPAATAAKLLASIAEGSRNSGKQQEKSKKKALLEELLQGNKRSFEPREELLTPEILHITVVQECIQAVFDFIREERRRISSNLSEAKSYLLSLLSLSESVKDPISTSYNQLKRTQTIMMMVMISQYLSSLRQLHSTVLTQLDRYLQHPNRTFAILKRQFFVGSNSQQQKKWIDFLNNSGKEGTSALTSTTTTVTNRQNSSKTHDAIISALINENLALKEEKGGLESMATLKGNDDIYTTAENNSSHFCSSFLAGVTGSVPAATISHSGGKRSNSSRSSFQKLSSESYRATRATHKSLKSPRMRSAIELAEVTDTQDCGMIDRGYKRCGWSDKVFEENSGMRQYLKMGYDFIFKGGYAKEIGSEGKEEMAIGKRVEELRAIICKQSLRTQYENGPGHSDTISDSTTMSDDTLDPEDLYFDLKCLVIELNEIGSKITRRMSVESPKITRDTLEASSLKISRQRLFSHNSGSGDGGGSAFWFEQASSAWRRAYSDTVALSGITHLLMHLLSMRYTNDMDIADEAENLQMGLRLLDMALIVSPDADFGIRVLSDACSAIHTYISKILCKLKQDSDYVDEFPLLPSKIPRRRKKRKENHCDKISNTYNEASNNSLDSKKSTLWGGKFSSTVKEVEYKEIMKLLDNGTTTEVKYGVDDETIYPSVYQPLLIRNAINDWRAMKLWDSSEHHNYHSRGSDIAYLSSKAGRRLVAVEMGGLYTDEKNSASKLMLMDEFIRDHYLAKEEHMNIEEGNTQGNHNRENNLTNTHWQRLRHELDDGEDDHGAHQLASTRKPAVYSRFKHHSFLKKKLSSQDKCKIPFLPPPYLAQYPIFDRIPELRRDIHPIPRVPLFREDKQKKSLAKINFWMGPEATVSPLHYDGRANILCQVRGEKYVRLYDPKYSKYLHARDGVLNNTSQIDIENVDRERFQDFSDLPYKEVILGPGDSLYIPTGQWHFVKALSRSISVNFWFNNG